MDDKNRIIKEQQMRASINAKLIETGERERFTNSYFDSLFFIL